MKYWTLVAVAVIVAGFLVAGCKPEEPPVYVGTWVNPANDGNGAAGPPGKIVATGNSFAMYEHSYDPSSATPTASGTYREVDAWDVGSDHYFKLQLDVTSPSVMTLYMLARVSNNHNTIEMQGSNSDDYPPEIIYDPKTVWTRQ